MTFCTHANAVLASVAIVVRVIESGVSVRVKSTVLDNNLTPFGIGESPVFSPKLMKEEVLQVGDETLPRF